MIYLLKNAIVNGFIRLFSDGTSKKWEVVLKIAIQQPAGFFFWSLRALWLAGNFQLGKRSQKLRGIPQASDPNWPWKIVEKWSLCLPLPQVTCLFFYVLGISHRQRGFFAGWGRCFLFRSLITMAWCHCPGGDESSRVKLHNMASRRASSGNTNNGSSGSWITMVYTQVK